MRSRRGRAVEAGACGGVLLRSTTDELVRAVQAVVTGRSYLDPGVGVHVVTASPDGLSERERQVLRLLALGYANKQIAAHLHLSVKTVETYKARALEKLDIGSRVELVRYGAERGWLADEAVGGVAVRRDAM